MTSTRSSPTPPATQAVDFSTDKMAPPDHGSRPSTSPGRNPSFKPVPLRAQTRHSIDLDDYFEGPRDMKHHSKWPYLLRLHGSVLPKMIIPLTIVASWSVLITCLCRFVYKLTVNSVLLTVLGFVVGLALSFRSSTAYERYAEGARYWATLQLASRNLSRMIWIHANERFTESPELGKTDVLNKITVINLICGFSVALKHRLRFEAACDYADLAPYVEILQTMAGGADHSLLHPRERSKAKAVGQYLGISFAESNPRKMLKKSHDNLGNLPQEILTYVQSYTEHIFSNGQISNGPCQSNIFAAVGILADVATGTERIVNHPMPLAYSISTAQITWVYVMMLPFQLYASLEWITIPATIVAAYIILGLAAIGAEIENPFGNDVNDLPLDQYCRELQGDMDVLTSISRTERSWDSFAPDGRGRWLSSSSNKVMWPLSATGYDDWKSKPIGEIREALWEKAASAAKVRKSLAYAEIETEDQLERERKEMTADVNARKSASESTSTTKATGHDAC